jgi:hypothetical protein
MKTKTMIAAGFFLLTASLAQATPALIDRTPGGFSSLDNPPVLSEFLDSLVDGFFDEVRNIPFDNSDGTVHPPGWVNLFGILHGQDYVQTDLLDNPGAIAHIQWDFSSLAHYNLVFIWVSGGDFINIYEVNPEHRISGVSDGFVPVTIDGHTPVEVIDFSGRRSVPEGSSTLGLMGMGLVALWAIRGLVGGERCEK